LNWIIKNTVQRVLGRIPAGVADPVYHCLQHVQGMKLDVQAQRNFLAGVVAASSEFRGRSLSSLRLVELGSGWFPVLPLLAVSEFGVPSVDTFDLNHHYSKARIAAAARAIQAAVPLLRSHAALNDAAESGRLPASIYYHPRTRAETIRNLRNGPADLAVSHAVLESIPGEDIKAIHRASRHWMTSQGVWVHLIGPSDERSYQDKRLHPVDFLRYSEAEWQRLSGNRYAYKNRLRVSEYPPIFRAAGWKVLKENFSVSKKALSALPKLPLHDDFKAFSPEELVAGRLHFVLGTDEAG
jgi:hypothetical protein